eukprot:394803-Prymnesium_polylepis.1
MAASHGHGPRHDLATVCSYSASPLRVDSSLERRRHHHHGVSRSLHALLHVPQRTHLPAAGFMASGAVPPVSFALEHRLIAAVARQSPLRDTLAGFANIILIKSHA